MPPAPIAHIALRVLAHFVPSEVSSQVYFGGRASTHRRALGAFLTLFVTASLSLGQSAGLSSRAPIGAYLDNKLPATAPSAATGWSTVNAFPNLTFRDPIQLMFEPRSNRLYVCTLWGFIHRFVNDPSTTSSTVFLDLSSRTQVSDNGGLMGMAFHPEFGLAGSPNRGYFYVFYQYSATPAYGYQSSFLRLSRFTVLDGATTASPTSEQVLIQQFDPHVWHEGGGIFFGTDGFLYISIGDAGGMNDAYNVTQRLDLGLFSGVLRIDVDRNPARSHPIRRQPGSTSTSPSQQSFSANYYIPNDNPFLDPGGSILEEFWALGFRNPHRATQDPVSGQIWLGDVGNTGAEEINIVVKGGNYQWPYKEALADGAKPKPNPLIGTDQLPLYTYFPLDGNTSVIGGYVYRGREHATLLDGMYIYGDNGSGRIWALNPAGGNPLYLCNLPPGTFLEGLSSFGVDQNGELYLCKMGNPGRIYKLSRTPPAGEREPPARLSETGVFSNLATLAPAPAFIPYAVNSPLWSDGAAKHRWMAVPNDGAPYSSSEAVAFSATGGWSFPAGTVFVKHFELPVDETNPALVKRLETRLLVRDATGGVYGLTYKWRPDGSDADLLPASATEDIVIRTPTGTRTQTWNYPSRQACLSCHTAGGNHVLGVNTRQLNGNFTYPSSGVTDNQLRTLNRISFFSPSINEANIAGYDKLVAVTDTAATPEHRVRSYLDANCAHCHNPSGARAFFDARYNTPLDRQGIIDGPVANSLGIADAHVISPRALNRSIMYLRVNSTGQIKMPPLARNVIDGGAVDTLEEWIATLQPSEPLPDPWENQDIGTTLYPGSTGYAGGTFTVRGSGSDIWGSADSFHFMHQPWTGDGEIVARVMTMENTDAWAKAGVMFRESLAAGARNALMVLTPGNGVLFQRRDSTNSTTSLRGGTFPPPPVWVKLVRSGSTFTGSYSTNGTTWSVVGSATISLPTTIYVGLAVTAHNAQALCTATFANVSVTGSGAPIVPAAPGNLMAAAASSTQINLTWTDNSSNEDSFQIERSTDGVNFTPIATVAANVASYSNTGLAPSTTYTYRARAIRGTASSPYSNTDSATTPAAPPPAPGNLVATAVSGSRVNLTWADNSTGEDGFEIERAAAGAAFTQIAVTTANATGYSDTTASAGVTYSYRVRATQGMVDSAYSNVATATTQPSPPPAAPGNLVATAFSATRIDLTWTDNSADEQQFSVERSTDGTTFAPIATVAANTTSYSNTGLTGATTYTYRVRATRDATNSAYSNPASATTPPTPAPPAAPTNLAATAASATRINLAWMDNSSGEDGFKIERSADGVSFTQIALTAANVTTYSDVGLTAATTYSYRVRATQGTLDSAYSNPSSATTHPLAPAEWISVDVGTVGVAGSHEVNGGTTTVRGSGHDIWDTSDAFHYYAQSLTGDGEIVARVTTVENTDNWAKAGVMMRASLNPNAPNALLYANPSFVTGWQQRSTAGGTIIAGSKYFGWPPAWVKLVRAGDVFTGYRSHDGVTWTMAGSITIAMPPTIYVGLAVTSHNNAVLCAGVFDNVTVTGSTAVLAAPANLTATAISSARIDLAWADNSTDEEQFKIERSIDGGPFAQIATVATNVTSYSNTGLASGTTHTYRVRASRGTADSAFSNTASATTPPTAPMPPAAPTALAATAASASRIDLAWTDNSTNETGFEIERSLDNVTFAPLASVAANTVAYSNTGLTASTTYYYRVRALNGTAVSAYSNTTSATTQAPPPTPPTIADQSATGVVGNAFNYQVQATGATSYSLVTAGSLPPGLALDTATGIVSGTPTAAGTTATQIRATNSNGSATATLTITINPAGEPPSIVDQNASGTAGQSFSYQIVASGATSYAATGLTGTGLSLNTSTGLITGTPSAAGSIDSTVTATNASGSRSATLVITIAAPPPADWNSRDIGAVAAAGSSSESGGIVTVRGSGADIWVRVDEFHYRYQSITGDGEIVARITTLTDTHAWAKAGVMFRESLDAPARHIIMAATPAQGMALQARLVAAGDSTHTSGSASAALPRWVRLVRTGNSFSGYESTNGTTWTLVGTHTLALASTINVGLAVTSHSDGTLCTATFDNVRVTGTSPPPPPPPAPPNAPTNLVATTASSTQINLAWTDASADETGFEIQRSTDNVTFTLLTTTAANTTTYANTGLTASTDYFYRVRAVNSAGVSAYSNVATARTPAPPPPPPAPPNPPTSLVATTASSTQINLSWTDASTDETGFELERSLDNVTFTLLTTTAANTTAYANTGLTASTDYFYRVRAINSAGASAYSNVATARTQAPPPPPTPPNPPTNLVATTISSTQINLAWTDASTDETGFEIQRSTDNATFTLLTTTAANITTLANTGLTASTDYFYRVRAVNSAGTSAYSNVASARTQAAPVPPPEPEWTSQDIGAVGITGSTTNNGTSVTLSGSGDDIWNNADEFRYHYRSWSGDGEIITHVTSLTDTHVWAKAGVMFRETLTATSRHAIMLVSVANGTAFQYRTVTGGTSGSSPPVAGAVPRWLRLVRSGNTLTGYASADGTTWTTAGTLTLELPASIYVGLAVTSHNDAALCSATFASTAVTGSSPPPPPINAPSGLVATTASSTQINLSWVDNSTNETGFEVERSTNATSYTRIATTAANATTFASTGLTASTQYFFRARAVNATANSAYSNVVSATTSPPPPPDPDPTWSFGDIGAVGVAGSNSSSGNTITISGSGADIWGTADAFRFVYRSRTGDGVVEARVTSMDNTNGWAKAGVMIRESLAPGSRNVFAFVTPVHHGIVAQVRAMTGGETSNNPGPVRNAPYWVRVRRAGDTFTASASPDGVTWTTIATYTMPMSATAFFGFAVTSHDNRVLNTAVFADPFVQ